MECTCKIDLRDTVTTLVQVHVVEADVVSAVLIHGQDGETGVLRLPLELLDGVIHSESLHHQAC